MRMPAPMASWMTSTMRSYDSCSGPPISMTRSAGPRSSESAMQRTTSSMLIGWNSEPPSPAMGTTGML